MLAQGDTLVYKQLNRKLKSVANQQPFCTENHLKMASKEDRKKIKAAFSEDEDDVEYMLPRKKQKKKTNTLASGFDLNLCPPSAASDAVKIQPYSIYLGRGIGAEIKEFRKNYYIASSKTVDSEIRNRFKLALDQLPILAKAVEVLQEYVKDQPTNSGL
ncbi:uncharacterized protein TNCT_243091 [Trichonephila clavata]|uniref:Uncharacterized protein n=1 Tax=Trichonephila clavata TaxID=2740835 RepID=A0A8X6EYD2_TRICU|nr:uncharacterized protein TNCT_243091 [Trichonephila clavata]